MWIELLHGAYGRILCKTSASVLLATLNLNAACAKHFTAQHPDGGIPLRKPEKGRRKGIRRNFRCAWPTHFLTIYNPDPDIMMMTRGTERKPERTSQDGFML
jgi:hypothetical protein